jgi:hypothetical protein
MIIFDDSARPQPFSGERFLSAIQCRLYGITERVLFFFGGILVKFLSLDFSAVTFGGMLM